MPVTAVLHKSRFFSLVPNGTTISMSSESREYCFDWRWLPSGVSLPGEPNITAGCGKRKESVFHARGYEARNARRYAEVWNKSSSEVVGSCESKDSRTGGYAVMIRSKRLIACSPSSPCRRLDQTAEEVEGAGE